jgi:hypothetical protein
MMKPRVTFISQNEPIDEYGRALYAVARSILRAFIDSLSDEDLRDLNTELKDVRFRQFAKIVRLERDKGMRGDGFEWAVHEAILGREETVIKHVHHALRRASQFVRDAAPTSLMYGYERAKFLGFLEAVVEEAGENSYLCPEGSGRPFSFGPWVATAAQGKAAEPFLRDRIKQIWKTDLFLSTEEETRFFAATVKSNYDLLEGGRGLRIGIVPESVSNGNKSGVWYDNSKKLWVVSLADPNGFMGLYNDAYGAVARAVNSVGKQSQPAYYTKPSAKALRLQDQLEKFHDTKILEIEEALNEAAQQRLISQSSELVSVNAPSWLHLKEKAPLIVAPKPSFVKLD